MKKKIVVLMLAVFALTLLGEIAASSAFERTDSILNSSSMDPHSTDHCPDPCHEGVTHWSVHCAFPLAEVVLNLSTGFSQGEPGLKTSSFFETPALEGPFQPPRLA